MSRIDGYSRYDRWMKDYPISDSLALAIFSGQADVLNHLIFYPQSLEEATLNDRLMELCREWYLSVKGRWPNTIDMVPQYQPELVFSCSRTGLTLRMV